MCRLFLSVDPADYEAETRAVRLHGHVTSIRLERSFWAIIEEIAGREDIALARFIGTLHDEMLQKHGEVPNFASLLRVTCLVVIVGSGAGGGTLGNELAQRGIKVVVLEAGARTENQDFVNDEWASFAQLAWTYMRTTSGNWRVAHDFPNLPAWIVKSVGGSTTHWAGASLRFEPHEFQSRTT